MLQVFPQVVDIAVVSVIAVLLHGAHLLSGLGFVLLLHQFHQSVCNLSLIHI